MIPKFEEYLIEIGIRGNFLERAEEVINFYSTHICKDLNEIFVSEYIEPEGNRKYESLWLFSDKYLFEAKNFLNEDDFDSAYYKNSISYWHIKKKDFNFLLSKESSRMLLRFSLTDQGCEMKASKENCDHLKNIFIKIVFPNQLVPSSKTSTGIAQK